MHGPEFVELILRKRQFHRQDADVERAFLVELIQSKQRTFGKHQEPPSGQMTERDPEGMTHGPPVR
jgi:hypothetical protein